MESSNFTRNRLATLATACSVVAACCLAFNSQASTYVLSDGGSTASVDVTSGAGMNYWDLGFGGNQLAQQWFWYRNGSGVAQPINLISAPTVSASTANFLEVSYGNAQFTLTLSYTLNGGGSGSGTADIFETISVLNHSGQTMPNFNLFQYSDFNLLGTPGGDVVNINLSPLNYVIQSEGAGNIGEVVTDPAANRAEAGLNGSILANFGIADYDLSNVLSAGPGDASWAFQWTASIANGSSLDIIKDKKITLSAIPEPSVAGLLAVSMGLAGMLLRRKS